MPPPPIRLAFGPALWRLFLVLGLAFEWRTWHHLRPFLRGKGTGFRLAALVLYTPGTLVSAFFITAIVTVLLDLIVRLLARPLVGRWYAPRGKDGEMASPLAFRLGSHEAILAELPARILSGRRARPGALVRTDRRVWFAPVDWDVEPWTIEDAALKEVVTAPSPSPLRAVIRGIPDRVTLRGRNGEAATFLIGDPRFLLAWYSEDMRRELDVYEPAPHELF